MASNFFCKFFHLVALGHFGFGLYYDYKFISPIEHKVRGFDYGGPLIYLTILASVRNFMFLKIFLWLIAFLEGCASDLLFNRFEQRLRSIDKVKKSKRFYFRKFVTATCFFDEFDVLDNDENWPRVGVSKSIGWILSALARFGTSHKCFDLRFLGYFHRRSSIPRQKIRHQRFDVVHARLSHLDLRRKTQHWQVGLRYYWSVVSTGKDYFLHYLWARRLRTLFCRWIPEQISFR